MGKAAITSVLTATANGIPLVPWQERVLAHFGLEPSLANSLIATSCALDPALPAPLADSERKKRIAACTRIVVGAAEAGEEGADVALRVLRKVAAQVVDNLEPLVDQLRDPSAAVLVVAGGLGQVEVFWRQVQDIMETKGWKWAEVVKIADPGMSGLHALLDRA
jgi:predicted secreted protein